MIGPLAPCVCAASSPDRCVCGPGNHSFWLGWLAGAVRDFLGGGSRADLRAAYRAASGRGAVDFRTTDAAPPVVAP